MRYILLILLINLILMPGYSVFAAAADNKVSTSPVTVSKSIDGTVEIIRYNYIAILYKQDKDSKEGSIKDYEAVFPIDNNTKYLNKKSLSDFAEGDKIEIRYDQTSWIDENGVGRSERVAREIRFIKSATGGLHSK